MPVEQLRVHRGGLAAEKRNELRGEVDFSQTGHHLSRIRGDFQTRSPAYPHLSITADVALHNRNDLLRALGAEVPKAPSAPDDSELLLAAYAKWGEDCANFLLGEFAFAIWDDRLKRLFCCRDHIGFRAFLYWRSRSRLIFAGNLRSILECDGVPLELNRRKLAGLAVLSGEHVHHEETFHAGILSLPPGAWMMVERDRARKQKYWEPKAGEGPAVPQRTDDAFEALREILFRAVECRLDPDYPVAVLLSGGLDSSAIVSIAARCLEKRNRQLTTISAVLPEESRPQFADERDYIDEFRTWPNVRMEYVTASGRGPFDSLNDLSRFAAFPTINSRRYLNEECEKAAISHGARTLLWGVGGEFGPTVRNERYYLELAIGLRWAALTRELGKNRQNVSPMRALARQFLNTLFPCRGNRPMAFLAPGFMREHDARPAWKDHSTSQRRYQAASFRYWLSKHSVARGQPVTLIPPSFPLLDKRVLEFCLALPASLATRDGYQRYLIRGALDRLLPRPIQLRSNKIPFSPDYFVRYNAQLETARDFVAAIGPKDPVRSVVDVEKLGKLLLPVDAAGSEATRDQVPVTIYTICFLRQFADFRP